MTREEEIEKQGTIYSDIPSNYIEWGDGFQDYDDRVYVERAFIEGAKWADEHPNSNGKELLYVAQKTAERTRKEVISKACEWIVSELYNSEDRDGYPNVESRSYVSVEDFINEFKKAMEL